MLSTSEKIILLDCDGPCADFDEAALRALDTFGMPIPNTKVNVLGALRKQHGVAMYTRAKKAIAYTQQYKHDFLPTKGAVRAVDTLRDAGFTIHWCVIVTGKRRVAFSKLPTRLP